MSSTRLVYVRHSLRATTRGLTELGETLALTLANLRAGDEMREQARRDPLTGAFNRRHFERAMERELARAREAGGPLAVALLDIDHFKRFNDTHGHAAGDAVLRHVAATLSARCRGSDVVCRYGGEEFVVLFPECDLEDAARKAEQLRLAVREMKVQWEGGALPQVTISLGVAAAPDEGLARDEILGAADEALYRSKAGGRDRVTRAQRASPASAA
jgi:diguanylate cyclase (GGDEF)-like protein